MYENEEAAIRIGYDYQADIPSIETSSKLIEDHGDQCLWIPGEVEDNNLQEFLKFSSDLGWDEFQAMCVLHVGDNDIEKSKILIEEYEPSRVSDSWTEEESAVFKSAFSSIGKNFFRIKTLFKGKTVQQMVEFYYYLKSRKLIRSPKRNDEHNLTDSVINYARHKNAHGPYQLDIYDIGKQIVSSSCDVLSCESIEIEKDKIDYQIKDLQGSLRENKSKWFELKSQKDMLVSVALESEHLCLDAEKRLAIKPHRPQMTFRWEESEIFLFTLGLKDFGKDFKHISKIICTKSEQQMRTFFEENHQRLMFDLALKEYHAKEKPGEMETDTEPIVIESVGEDSIVIEESGQKSTADIALSLKPVPTETVDEGNNDNQPILIEEINGEESTSNDRIVIESN